MEAQVCDRLASATGAEWHAALSRTTPAGPADALAKALAGAGRAGGTPLTSLCRADAVYDRVRAPYEQLRLAIMGAQRERFDEAFAKWLFWVFDPLSALRAYFGSRRREWRARVLSGVGTGYDPDKVLDMACNDWEERRYSPEDQAWIAWLLRFTLSERSAPDDHFRGLPVVLPQPSSKVANRWTHVVIDEAQDLSVPEASLLASFVDPEGALTVSADFHQVVSPVHGMTEPTAFRVGLPLRGRDVHTQFPFTKNLRQSREIGLFLGEFYRRAFQEIPPFEAGPRVVGSRPAVYTGQIAALSTLLKQMVAVLGRSQTVARVAVILVNEDQRYLGRLMQNIQEGGATATEDCGRCAKGTVVVTSAERAKGLEFDACIVLGLEDLGRSALNFAKNRAYVALSRATQRLFVVADEFPRVLYGMPKELYDRHHF